MCRKKEQCSSIDGWERVFSEKKLLCYSKLELLTPMASHEPEAAHTAPVPQQAAGY